MQPWEGCSLWPVPSRPPTPSPGFPALWLSLPKSSWHAGAHCFAHLMALLAHCAAGAHQCHTPLRPGLPAWPGVGQPGREEGSLRGASSPRAFFIAGRGRRVIPLRSKPSPSTQGQSWAALLQHQCPTQSDALDRQHQWQGQGLGPGPGPGMARCCSFSRATGLGLPTHAVETWVTPHHRLTGTGTTSSAGPFGAGKQHHADRHRWARLPMGTTLRINHHAHTIVVKHLLAQVI